MADPGGPPDAPPGALPDLAPLPPEALRAAPGAADPLRLRPTLADWLLPAMVAAMTLLAALALAGAHGAAGLAARWEAGAAASIMVQLPPPAPGTTQAAALRAATTALRRLPEVAEVQPLDPPRLRALLRPWLGEATALPLPIMVELRLHRLPADPAGLAARIGALLPAATVEAHGVWVGRLAALSRSLQGLALAALALVVAIAVAVVAVAVRAALTARREAIEILHAFGATDAAIAGRFARWIAALVGAGAVAGTLVALPALVGLARLAAPLLGGVAPAPGLPWLALLLLPAVAAATGWAATQATVRPWLARLP